MTGARPYTFLPMADLPSHLDRPHIRQFHPIGVENDQKKVFVALRDPANLRGDGQCPVVPPEILPLLGAFRGEKSLQEISELSGAPTDFLVQLVKALDESGLLWGPNCDRLEREAMTRVVTDGGFRSAAAEAAGATAEEAKKNIGEWLAAAEDPELDGELLGIVTPHMDYARSKSTYAAAYKSIGTCKKFARVVILGTNHFGSGDGIVMSRHGFLSPFGAFAPDAPLLDALASKLGDRLFKDEVDLLGEHSISIQLPWIHEVIGRVPIVAALVPSPLVPMIADDGARVSFDEFVPVMQDLLNAAEGQTLVVASADLSHVGPQFGDQTPVGTEIRRQVEAYDRSLLSTYLEGNMEAFLGKVGHDQNHQRWCSIGNMTAAKLMTGGLPELVEYSQSPAELDPQGAALVTCAAMALLKV